MQSKTKTNHCLGGLNFYLFRSVSHNDNSSNPSKVIEVQLLEDADEVMLRTRTFDIFPDPKKFDTKTGFRKFFQIIANTNHTVIEDGVFENMPCVEDAETNFYLGTSGENELWDFNSKNSKYIKMRLTSKQTGKKIDINLTYNIKKDEE